MSRREAFDSFTLSDFKKAMEGIYSTSVQRETLDECPMVYKPMEEIMQGIRDTAGDIAGKLEKIVDAPIKAKIKL